MRKRVRQDYDAVAAITGDEGVSKSTAANWIGFKTDKNYTLEKNCLFSPNPKELTNAIRNLPRFSTVNADEAIKILYKQQWWLQTFINKFYRLCRQDNKISIMCMPRFTEFNEGFRNHRILFWIHLLDRGIGVVFQKDWSPFSKDPWQFDKNQKSILVSMRSRKFHHIALDTKIKILSRSENFIDVVTFPDLPEEIRIKYKTLAATHKYEGIDEEYAQGFRYQKMKEKWEFRMKKFIEMLEEAGYTQKEIALKIGMSRSLIGKTKAVTLPHTKN